MCQYQPDSTATRQLCPTAALRKDGSKPLHVKQKDISWSHERILTFYVISHKRQGCHCRAMKPYKRSVCTDPVTCNSAQDGGEWPTSGPGRLNPGAHWVGVWVGPRAGLNLLENTRISCPSRDSSPELSCLHPIFHSDCNIPPTEPSISTTYEALSEHV